MATLGQSLFLPFSTQGILVGLLILGYKKSARLLWRLNRLSASECDQLATIIEDARLHQRLKKQYERSAPNLAQAGQTEPEQLFEQTTKGIAHDLNNILATILSHTQLLEIKEKTGETKPHTAAIRQAVQDGVESVRWIQRFREPKTDSESYPVEVNDIVRSTLQMIEPHWHQGRISSSSAVGKRSSPRPVSEANTPSAMLKGPPPDLAVNLRPAGYVWGSPAELRRVLANIISNAVEALPSQHGRIEISSGQEDHWAIIKVKDNGTGMAPEIRRQIFVPSFSTKGSRGSGLGLSISKEIVVRHGGRIEVETQEGSGSTFTVFLPLSER